MTRPRVYVTTCELPSNALTILRKVSTVRTYGGVAAPPKGILLEEVKEATGLLCTLTDRIDAEVLDGSKRLRIVANMAVGYDNIDLKEATRRRVMVTNTPGVLTETVADATFALMLALARRIPEAERFLREGLWRIRWSPMMMVGRDVYGKTLGIYGLGRIGRAVAKRASGFGMRVIYYDTVRNLMFEEEHGATYVPLEQLFSRSDFVTVHVPLTPGTKKSVGKKEFALMKRSAYLINTSRGEVLDQDALVQVLKRNRIAGAALDVFEHEPLEANSELLKMKNVVLTPHLSSASVETRTEMATMAARNIADALAGESPPNLLNRDVLPKR
jgi:glyoxylate reductase